MSMEEEDAAATGEGGEAGGAEQAVERVSIAGEEDENKKLDTKKLRSKKKKTGKTGVVYISRIPPHLKPQKLRHLLSQYAEVSRIYLAPEDNASRIKRKRAGGNTGKNFVEGWVEFVHKRDAKRLAAMLNGQPVDPKKRSAYHYDLWTMKYLKRFKWDNLTAEIAYKKAVRDQKIAAEVSAAKKERDFYLAKVDQARAISSMEERKNKRKVREENEIGEGASFDDALPAKKARVVRNFNQRKRMVDSATEIKPRLADDVLARIFGSSNRGAE